MNSFGPTAVADCEIIIKAFEKAAIYSTDPKSVYAMTTPVLSKMRSDARNTQSQFQKQFDFMDKMKDARDIQNAGMNRPYTDPRGKDIVAAVSSLTQDDLDQAQKDARSEEEPPPPLPEVGQENRWVDDAWGSNKPLEERNAFQRYVMGCIPCEQRVRNAEQFHNQFWADQGGWKDQWLDMQEAALMGAMQKLAKILNMFRDLGTKSIQSICSFFDIFNYRCPTDLVVMIKALSGLLVKISIDLLGDMNFLMDIVSSLIGPLLSGFIQLMKNYVMAIIDPIWCIIDAIQLQIRALIQAQSEAGSLVQDVFGNHAGLGAGVNWAAGRTDGKDGPIDIKAVTMDEAVGNYLWNTTPDVQGGQDTKIKAVTNPWTGEELLSDTGISTGAPGSDTAFTTVSPFAERSWAKVDKRKEEKRDDAVGKAGKSWDQDLSYRRYVELDEKIGHLEALQEQGRKINQEEYEKLKNERDDSYVHSGWNQYMKATADAMDEVDEQQANVMNMLTSIARYLTEMGLWVENFLKDWIKEFGRLVGDSFTGEIGFLNKQEKKLTTLQLISVLTGAVALMEKGFDCDNEEALEKLLTKKFGFDKAVVKKEDGRIVVVNSKDGNTLAAITNIWESKDIDLTENVEFDTVTQSVQELHASPTEMVFSCNKLKPSADNAAQISQWMKELDGTPA